MKVLYYIVFLTITFSNYIIAQPQNYLGDYASDDMKNMLNNMQMGDPPPTPIDSSIFILVFIAIAYGVATNYFSKKNSTI
ncbi:MAG: hypothetical protein KAG96_06930 [Ichthyobacteriaceae bacterium]|nr:hypothetical protein [Ichthyobacteriaceae bacterium]